MSVESDVRESLRSVEDPEMKISVIELGLIYEIRAEDKDDGTHIEVDMTLTSRYGIPPEARYRES